jgi:tetratricopeptide (TPR) repeat protein
LRPGPLATIHRWMRCVVSEETLSEDRGFADAYSGASCSLYLEWLLLGGNDPTLLTEARELAEQAIRHDPSNSAGYWRKAMVGLYQHDFDGSQECFVRARELHPNSADILLDHSDAMGFVGDADQAWTMFERAIDLNPTPPDHYWWAGATGAAK